MEYNEKTKKICKYLGAEHFQKLVFILEKVKYILIKNIFPNTIDWYEKKCLKEMNKKIEKTNDEIEKEYYKYYYRKEILNFKREVEKEENRNYHINFSNIDSIKKYLELNKQIHIESLINNLITTPIILLVMLVFNNPFPIITYILLFLESIGIVINFECINLQNYNLCRISDVKIKKSLNKIKERNELNFKKNMSNGVKALDRAFSNTNNIPTVDDVISNVVTKEEAIELLNYAKKELNKKTKKKVLERK